MARLIASVLVVLALSIPARATLVVVVPSASGLVVAADSRESILGEQCDGLFKIVEPRSPSRTVVIVTGDAVFVEPPSTGSTGPGRPQSLCAYLESAPRLLDIAAVVADDLEHSKTPFDRLRLEDLGAQCVAAVQQFQATHPDALRSYIGRDVFSVVIAHYEPGTSTSTLLNFVVRIDSSTRQIQFDTRPQTIIGPHDRRGVWAFGETDYLTQNVYRGAGRKYLNEPTQKFILDAKPVMDAPLDESVDVAVNVIHAASRTAETVPAPSGIGGPINVVLLGSRRRPQTIHTPGLSPYSLVSRPSNHGTMDQ